MLSNNNKENIIHATLAFTILSLNVLSLLIIATSNYANAQVSSNNTQNATTTGGISSANNTGMNVNASIETTARANQKIVTEEVRSLLEQARSALQNNDIQSALKKLNLAVHTLERLHDSEQSNMTATTTTEAATIGSGGAGGAGTAGGIVISNQTTAKGGTIGSGGAGGAGTAGGIITGPPGT